MSSSSANPRGGGLSESIRLMVWTNLLEPVVVAPPVGLLKVIIIVSVASSILSDLGVIFIN